jgi:hypothetical protein
MVLVTPKLFPLGCVDKGPGPSTRRGLCREFPAAVYVSGVEEENQARKGAPHVGVILLA